MKFEDRKNKERILTAIEVSKILRIPLNTIYRLSKQGKLKGVKIGKHWRYEKSDIERYISFGTDFSREPARKHTEFTERRSYPRINTNFNCQYSINLPPFKEINSEGIIKDLSASGVFLVNQNAGIDKINTNDPIDLNFNLVSKEEITNIRTEGKVIRKSDSGLGIKFRNIPDESRNKIIQYIG